MTNHTNNDTSKNKNTSLKEEVSKIKLKEEVKNEEKAEEPKEEVKKEDNKIEKEEKEIDTISSDKSLESSKKPIIIAIIGILILIASIVFIYMGTVGKNKKPDSELTDNERYSKYYKVYTVQKKPVIEGIKINGKKVDLKSKYHSIKFKEIHKIKDVFIVEFEALFTKKDDTYNGVLYAISEDGNVLWYEKPQALCEKDNNKLCRGVVGYHFSEDFDYSGKYYKISDDKITFVSEITSADPVASACKLAYDADFTVEYEIDYLGDNKFSEMKKLQSLSAGQYLDRERSNGVEINCSDYE